MRLGLTSDGDQDQRQHIVDALEVTNAECQGIHAQLQGVMWPLNYLANVIYKVCIEDGKNREEEGKGTVFPERQETQEAGVETSKVLEGNREDTEDQGEGPSGLSAVDKGKGKEVQEEEETLQEE